MEGNENKIELMYYLNVLWKRKWFIVLFTLISLAVSILISFILPPKWEVEAIILPPKVLYHTEEGVLETAFFVTPRKMAGRINQSVYNSTVAAELNIDIQDFPVIRAATVRNTSLVRIYTQDKDVEKAKLILKALINHLKETYDAIAKREVRDINAQIKNKEKEKSILKEKTEISSKNLNSLRQRKNEIKKDIRGIQRIIEGLEKERRPYLNKKSRSESESLTLLLLSSEIQSNMITLNMLNESIISKQMEENNKSLDLRNYERMIEGVDLDINDLNKQKNRISYTEFTKDPTSSFSPVSPKKPFIISIATLFGFIISVVLAFSFEFFRQFEPEKQ